MLIIDHRLTEAEFHASPNFNQRPSGMPIDLLVIHNISLPPGEFDNSNILDFFTNQLNVEQHPYFKTIEQMQVSAHLVINRTGVIQQFVSFDQRAWHAGESEFRGRKNCNDFSIGIELEGEDDVPYTTTQYQQLIKVTQLLLVAYPGITPDRIVGHSDIAPRRKTDPGKSFDWAYYRQYLGKNS